MKQQLVRLSPHQNAKVFAVMMAVSSLVFAVPFFLIPASMFEVPGSSPPFYVILAIPIIYLVLGYVGTFIGCLVYNFLYRFVGGIEFESESV
ncbi:MAG: hypothetical protein KKC79_03530 [Gammaproteobacteria bacterium]|nr:hypothetical protein [Gammaproteobacteria bacterium]MBU1441937.1 hypothetical protein [Gammaproteobacteria bacterium]MBU2289356.1 hypothetical protein [Gammaproteobacteria bacterium]MBU2407701.1 hypothetical protein [Gammaproteobacteria bacterium]